MDKPIVFLDMDGVMNCEQRKPPTLSYWVWIDPVAVRRLNTLTSATDADIVISSSWRLYNTLDELRRMYEHAGITACVIDLTPVLIDHARHHEIRLWLHRHQFVENYVILDDDPKADLRDGRYIQTTWARGLEPKHVKRAIQILGRKQLTRVEQIA